MVVTDHISQFSLYGRESPYPTQCDDMVVAHHIRQLNRYGGRSPADMVVGHHI